MQMSHHDKLQNEIIRRHRIVSILGERYYVRALHISAEDGFITTAIPAWERYGYNWGEIKSDELPSNVVSVSNPKGEFDLIIATELTQYDYDNRNAMELIKKYAKHHILVGGMKSFIEKLDFGFTTLAEMEFPYMGGVQKVILFQTNK